VFSASIKVPTILEIARYRSPSVQKFVDLHKEVSSSIEKWNWVYYNVTTRKTHLDPKSIVDTPALDFVNRDYLDEKFHQTEVSNIDDKYSTIYRTMDLLDFMAQNCLLSSRFIRLTELMQLNIRDGAWCDCLRFEFTE
jgi:hypothetical protein